MINVISDMKDMIQNNEVSSLFGRLLEWLYLEAKVAIPSKIKQTRSPTGA